MARGSGGPLHKCFIGDCETWCVPTAVACGRHLGMLTDETRAALWKTYRPRTKPTRRFLDVLKQALREVIYYEENGHHWPVARELDL